MLHRVNVLTRLISASAEPVWRAELDSAIKAKQVAEESLAQLRAQNLQLLRSQQAQHEKEKAAMKLELERALDAKKQTQAEHHRLLFEKDQQLQKLEELEQKLEQLTGDSAKAVQQLKEAKRQLAEQQKQVQASQQQLKELQQRAKKERREQTLQNQKLQAELDAATLKHETELAAAKAELQCTQEQLAKAEQDDQENINLLAAMRIREDRAIHELKKQQASADELQTQLTEARRKLAHVNGDHLEGLSRCKPSLPISPHL